MIGNIEAPTHARLGTLEESAACKAAIIWRLIQADTHLRILLVDKFLDDLERGYESRKRLYDDKKRGLAFDQEYLEESEVRNK